MRGILLENSRDITGALKSALAIKRALTDVIDITVVSPSSASAPVVRFMLENKIKFSSLPLIEVGRSGKRLASYFPMLLFNAYRLRKLLQLNNTEIIIVNDYYNLLGALLKAVGWRGRLITYVRLLPHRQHPMLNSLWIWAAFRYSHAVIAVSKAVAEQLPKDKKLHLVYDPIGITNDRFEVSSPFKGSGRAIRFLYLANYIGGKGQLTALRAFHIAYSEANDIRLRFIGSDMGIKKNQAFKLNLISEVERLGLTEVVEVLGPSENVKEEIRSSDVLLNFSEAESFSRTCLEGSAGGRPVIATRCGGPEEIIDDGVSGLLVPVGDVPAMAREIVRLARDSQVRDRMGNAGSKLVHYRFSEERFLKKFSCILETKHT